MSEGRVKAIVTKQTDEGTYEVTNSRDKYVTGPYSTPEELVKNHHVPWHWSPAEVRFEFFRVEDPGMTTFATTYKKV